MRDTNTEVRVEGGFRNDGTVQLTITDGPSSTTMVALEFTAAEWLRLTAGSGFTHQAWVTRQLGRIGKTMKHRTLEVPREVTQGIYKQGPAEDAAEAWGELQALPYEEVEARSTNAGWRVILRRWEP